MMSWLFFALCLGVLSATVTSQNCADDRFRKCMGIAEPMLKDPHLIFPDNLDDINSVCRTWSDFVDCIHRYIDKCFNKVRKVQFQAAVEPPIATVHQMCSVSSYQTEYLQYASCIKSMVINPEHCGNHYSTLVNEVSLDNVRKPNLCCAYHNFRTCVIVKTRLRCDLNQPEGVAAKFSRQVLDKAFRFLQDQCTNYMLDTGKCSTVLVNSTGISSNRYGEGRSVNLDNAERSKKIPNSFIDIYRSKINEQFTSTVKSTSIDFDTRTNIGSHASATSAFLNTHNNRESLNKMNKINEDLQEVENSRKTESTYFTTSFENSANSRPTNYARGISWPAPTSTSPPTTTTVKTTTNSYSSKMPEWATSPWRIHDQTTEEIWYPAAGSFGGNHIDEPNQQGLSNRKSQSSKFYSSLAIISIFLSSLIFIF